MRRIKNFRAGDRAEKFGIFLLQAFCAVAEVPRPEDFGLMDAVATLLREDGKFLYAEDSFLVQLKSRTEKKIEYLGDAFKALKQQDLPVFVAHVDLTKSSVELYTLGEALAHPNINDIRGLVFHLKPRKGCPLGFVDDVIHVPLIKPILRWSTQDTENRAFTDKAYAVLKSLLALERWNRRYRAAGLSRQICWETNEVPTAGGQTYSWNPARGQESLGELVPLVSMLNSHAMQHAELREPLLAIVNWLQAHGIQADPNGSVSLTLQMSDSRDRMQRALNDNPGADVAFTFWLQATRPDFLNFWLFGLDRKGTGSGNRCAGSLQAIRELGFVAEQDIAGNQATLRLGLSDAWLEKHHFVPATPTSIVDSPAVAQGGTEIFLLRRTS
jgi:hypothetical protein